jgi:hypothetical protein
VPVSLPPTGEGILGRLVRSSGPGPRLGALPPGALDPRFAPPQRTALFLAGPVIYSFLLTIMLGSHGALAQTDKTATPGRRCTMSQDQVSRAPCPRTGCSDPGKPPSPS